MSVLKLYMLKLARLGFTVQDKRLRDNPPVWSGQYGAVPIVAEYWYCHNRRGFLSVTSVPAAAPCTVGWTRYAMGPEILRLEYHIGVGVIAKFDLLGKTD